MPPGYFFNLPRAPLICNCVTREGLIQCAWQLARGRTPIHHSHPIPLAARLTLLSSYNKTGLDLQPGQLLILTSTRVELNLHHTDKSLAAWQS